MPGGQSHATCHVFTGEPLDPGSGSCAERMNETSQLIISIAYALALALGGFACLWRSRIQSHEQPPSLPRGRVQTWFYQRGDLLVVLLIYLVLSTVFLLGTAAPPVQAEQISAAALAVGIGSHLILTALVINHVLRRATLNEWLGLRWRAWPWLLLIGPGTVIVMGLINWLILSLGYMEWIQSLQLEAEQDPVAILRNSKDPAVVALMVIAATVIAPLWEEIVFRGYLHPVLKKYGGIWTGALCSSLFFSAVHHNVAAMLPLFLLGLLMVWLYERTGSIWTPIAMHFCFNATAVCVLLFGPQELPQAVIWP